MQKKWEIIRQELIISLIVFLWQYFLGLFSKKSMINLCPIKARKLKISNLFIARENNSRKKDAFQMPAFHNLFTFVDIYYIAICLVRSRALHSANSSILHFTQFRFQVFIFLLQFFHLFHNETFLEAAG